jgi:hypothetical protein
LAQKRKLTEMLDQPGASEGAPGLFPLMPAQDRHTFPLLHRRFFPRVHASFGSGHAFHRRRRIHYRAGVGEIAMKLVVLSGALIMAGVLNASADTYVFKDVQRPHGRDRSMAAKDADAKRCGWLPDGRVLKSADGMQQCMLSHGWAVSQYIPGPGKPPEGVQFTDLSRSGKRGDAAVRADSNRCDPNNRLSATSLAFRQCMLKRGWSFYAYVPPAAQPAADDDSGALAEQNATDSAAREDEQRRDDEQRQNDQATQDMINSQQMINDQQNMINNQISAAQ